MHIPQTCTNSIGDYDVKPSWLHLKKPYLMWKQLQMKSVSFSRWEDFPVDKYIILFMTPEFLVHKSDGLCIFCLYFRDWQPCHYKLAVANDYFDNWLINSYFFK